MASSRLIGGFHTDGFYYRAEVKGLFYSDHNGHGPMIGKVKGIKKGRPSRKRSFIEILTPEEIESYNKKIIGEHYGKQKSTYYSGYPFETMDI